MHKISSKSYRNAQKVLHSPMWSLYSAKTYKEAERLVSNYDEGATFERKPAEFSPKPNIGKR